MAKPTVTSSAGRKKSVRTQLIALMGAMTLKDFKDENERNKVDELLKLLTPPARVRKKKGFSVVPGPGKTRTAPASPASSKVEVESETTI